MSDDKDMEGAPRTPLGSPALLAGRLLLLYAGAGNKFVPRHIELHPDGKLHVLLDGTSDPQQIISLKGCVLANVPEHPRFGFAICRSMSETDPTSPSRLGQLVFLTLRLPDKTIWMEKIQELIWQADEQLENSSSLGGTTSAAASAAPKQSRFQKLRFSTANYVIDRGLRPPLLQGFVLKRTGNFLQDYVVRWAELRDRISNETTALGGILFASYTMAPPGEWGVVPVRIDTKITTSPAKNRICVAGPNQESVFFKFNTQSQMEEWGSTLLMLAERAKIENDPQFAMQMKLGSGGNDLSSRGGGRHMSSDEQEALADTMTAAKLRKLQVGGDGGDGNDDDDDDDERFGHTVHRGSGLNLAYDSDDEDDGGAGGDDEDDFDSDADSDTTYEMRDLMSDSPPRQHFARILYALDRTVHADRDSSSVLPRLQDIISSSPAMFRPDVSPYVPRHGNNNDNSHQQQHNLNLNHHSSSAAATGGFLAHDTSSQFNVFKNMQGDDAPGKQGPQNLEPFSPGPREESQVTVEDVLERFERRLLVAVELLGPSAVVSRLLKELDSDSSDLKHVALHILDKFPRQIRAAQIASKLDEALGNFQAIRESILVRVDMARFREEFRIGSSSGSASSAAAAGGGGGVGGSAAGAGSIRAPPKTSDSAAQLTVDDALKVIHRIVIEGAESGAGAGEQKAINRNASFSSKTHQLQQAAAGRADSTSKLRDAIQFLTHFLSQFREAFDVFDDAGYVVDEVGSAIEQATKFLQDI